MQTQANAVILQRRQRQVIGSMAFLYFSYFRESISLSILLFPGVVVRRYHFSLKRGKRGIDPSVIYELNMNLSEF